MAYYFTKYSHPLSTNLGIKDFAGFDIPQTSMYPGQQWSNWVLSSEFIDGMFDITSYMNSIDVFSQNEYTWQLLTLSNGNYVELHIKTGVQYSNWRWSLHFYYQDGTEISGLIVGEGTDLNNNYNWDAFYVTFAYDNNVLYSFTIKAISGNNVQLETKNEVGNNLNLWIDGAEPSSDIIGTGGGATHMAKVAGLLSTLSSNLSDILIVAGGGGGGMVSNETEYDGANAGGISGSGSNSADQSTGYAFGQGETSGGGSGLYGGYKAANSNGGGAGSGHIGNALLDAKKMVGYNVPTSSTASTKTESVNTYSATAEANTPKAGNGYARIKWLRGLPE